MTARGRKWRYITGENKIFPTQTARRAAVLGPVDLVVPGTRGPRPNRADHSVVLGRETESVLVEE